MDYCVYILHNTRNIKTYMGITNNSKNRLRKHNGEIKGGAKYTRAFKGKGKWFYYCKVKNLDKQTSQSIEMLCKKGKGKTLDNLKKICNNRELEIIYFLS